MNKGLLVVLIAIAGCVGYKYSTTTSVTAPSKPESCEFDVLSTRPDRPYDELGVLETSAGYEARSVSSFRDAILRDVCRAGGDAVLAEVNGLGHYVRGTVIRYRSP
jgi:hypothetical protein